MNLVVCFDLSHTATDELLVLSSSTYPMQCDTTIISTIQQHLDDAEVDAKAKCTSITVVLLVCFLNRPFLIVSFAERRMRFTKSRTINAYVSYTRKKFHDWPFMKKKLPCKVLSFLAYMTRKTKVAEKVARARQQLSSFEGTTHILLSAYLCKSFFISFTVLLRKCATCLISRVADFLTSCYLPVHLPYKLLPILSPGFFIKGFILFPFATFRTVNLPYILY